MRVGHRIVATCAALVLFMTVGSACLLADATPSPHADKLVWVEWENRTEETYHLTITHGAGQVAWAAEVEPCIAHGAGMEVDGPFDIGVAPWDRELADPGRHVADSSDWEAAGDEFLLVIIEEDGLALGTTAEQRTREPACG